MSIRKLDFFGVNCRNAAAEVIERSILEFEASHLDKIRNKALDITSKNIKLDDEYETRMRDFVLYVKKFDFVLPW